MSISPALRVRLLAAVALSALGSGTGMMALGIGPFATTTDAPTASDVTPRVQTPKPAKASAVKATAPTKTQAAAKQKPAATVETPPAPAAAPPVEKNTTGLPDSVAAALERHEVVVVSLVSPRAPLDDLALREARAGATRAGAGFVRLPVVSQTAMKQITEKFGVRHTPTVLVFARPNRLFVQVEGFVDGETVAQAATSASS